MEEELKIELEKEQEVLYTVKNDVDIALSKLIGVCLDKGITEEIQVRSKRMAAILGDF